ncbi:MAG: protein translocase subunit SecDF [Chlorobi bacterium]|nr:protein translocase subunit SecDF [Chlorobiota bacterium]
MSGKGFVKTFAILLGLLSLYQLSFTFIDYRIKKKAKEYAQGDYTKERRYLDSVKNKPVYNFLGINFTHKEVKDRAMKLGLDLQGGINVILQISVRDILKDLANHTHDPDFNRALKMADEMQKKSDKPYLDLFFEAWDQIAEETGKKLSDPKIFGNKKLANEITLDMSDDQVKRVIRRKVDEAMVSAFEVLRKRIDKFGVASPNIQRLGKSGRILVELAGAKDVERIKKLLQSTAQLEFWPAYRQEDYIDYIRSVDRILAAKYQPAEADTTGVEGLIAEDSLGQADAARQFPFSSLIKRPGGGPIVGYFEIKDTARVNAMLRDPDVVKARPDHLRYAKFLWGKTEPGKDIVPLYVVRGNRENIPPLGGSVITDARQEFDEFGKPKVTMAMNSKGAKIWEKLTAESSEQQTGIAIVLDNVVYSAPVAREAIRGGRSEISGNFTIEEAQDLANVLRAGKLPARAEIIQSEIVGPTLGKESIRKSLVAFFVALILVMLWMMFYYGRAGVVASIVLLVNLIFVFGILASLGLVLTLPGIAGIILTIGMAVDANVLIYERIREELRMGKNIKQAVAEGYRNALSSILDANITTLITGFILFVFGTGPIQGFATTLIIGILTSLFTAILLSRVIIEKWIERYGTVSFSTKFSENILTNVNIDFLGKRKIAYMVSGTLILISLISIFTKGLNPGVDFVGGRTYTVRFDKPVNPNEVAKALGEVFVDEKGNKVVPEVKTFGGDNQLKITTKYKIDVEGEQVDEEIQHKLYEGLRPFLPEGFTYEEFIGIEGEKQYGIMQSIKVGPTIADDIKKGAIWAILISLVMIFLYILFRFKYWQFSVGAIAALVHDVTIVLGIFSLTYDIMPFDMEVDQSFIAAILTVIGYSLNDTVVIFDRIREYMRIHLGWKLPDIINKALNSTLSRTLNTSFTTLLVLLVVLIFGGESIRGFIFALTVGVIVGTYSSLFVATPVMYDLLKNQYKKGKLKLK